MEYTKVILGITMRLHVGIKEYKMYVNGKLVAKTINNTLLSNISSNSFSIGQDINNNFLFKNGSIDELRISDIVRNTADIFNSYVKGIRVDIRSPNI